MKTIKFLFFLACSISLFSFYSKTNSFSAKTIQKDVVIVEDNLYASKHEVSNKLYRQFLQELIASGKTEEYAKARVDTVQWDMGKSYFEPMKKLYHSHPAYDNYPVVNVSADGAKLFCEWLTEKYNSTAHRKYQKVIFRLPTKDEWTSAAKGGNLEAVYPWNGQYMRNKKGLFMCNFKQVGNGDAANSDDAFILTVVDAYWPNNFGLYNMSGNAAELLADGTHAIGGSWIDPEEMMRIDNDVNVVEFQSAKPYIGFRYFMEIVEK